MKKLSLCLLFLLFATNAAIAQQVTARGVVVSSCAGQSLSAGQNAPITLGTDGALCVNATVSATATVENVSATGAAVPAKAGYIGASVAGTLTGVTATNNGGKISIDANITGGSTGNGAASNTGSAVPTQGDYQGVNVGGTLRGLTGTNTSGSVYAADTNVVASALPSGASTSAKQPALGTAGTASSDVITVQGVASMTPILATLSGTNTVTAVTAITNALPAGTNAIGKLAANSGVDIGDVDVTSIAAGTNIIGKVGIDQTTDGTTNKVYVGNISADAAEGDAPTSNPVPMGCRYRTSLPTLNDGDIGYAACGDSSGRLGVSVVNLTSDVAVDAATSGNPVYVGALYEATPTSVSASGDRTAAHTTIDQRLLTYNVPGTLASGAITSAMTGTTSTSLIGATASNYIYVTQCTVSNTDDTTDTEMILQDGSGGTTLYTIPAPHNTGGASISFPTPLKVPTAGNALFVANVTSGATTKASCVGYKSTVSY